MNAEKQKKILVALDGYSAVVTRRRGMARVSAFILGSVSFKLLENLSYVPLLLAGRKTPDNRYLVAFDGSAGAMKAVKFAASLLKGQECEFLIFSVIRSGEGCLPEPFPSDERFVQGLGKNISDGFREAVGYLAAHGFDKKKIATEFVSEKFSRAGTISEAAARGNYATIIMGRRGFSRPKEFTLGRVTHKVVYLAREHAVWIV